jgi:transcriptional regulator with XRE-family HTH domain
LSTPNDRNNFAARLRALMKQRNITMYRLHQEIGKSTTIIGHWLRAENFPSLESLKLLENYFWATISFLKTGEEDPRTSPPPPTLPPPPPHGLPDVAIISAARDTIAAAAGLDLDRVSIILDFGSYAVRV